MNEFRIEAAHVRRVDTALVEPLRLSFGTRTTRDGVFLIIVDDAGRQGVGESWVNWPIWAPWERVAAFERAIIPYLEGRCVADVPQFMGDMYRAFAGAAVQSGTVGPLLSALCAVELALWDLQAQAAGAPLATHLWGTHAASVRVYASGLSAPLPYDLIDTHLDWGVTLFKLKLGFGDDVDRHNLDDLKRHLDGRADIAVDSNRKWVLEDASRWMPILGEYEVQWLEEPVRPDDEVHLAELRAAGHVPLAGGENIMMPPDVDLDEIAGGDWDIFQPDLTKYTPLHVAVQFLDATRRANKRLVPHFLGSGPGQAATIHFAAGCPEALVELDVSRNALRTESMEPPFQVVDGAIELPQRPGLGWRLTL